MAKSKDETQKPIPTHQLMSDERARQMLNVKEAEILQVRVNELANLLWHHEGEN